MKKLILFTYFCLIINCVFAQNRGNIWCFGDSAGIDFNNTSAPVPISSAMDGRGSCVTIADNNGNLILYAATVPYIGPNSSLTTYIFNSQNQVIQGADSIAGEAWYNELVIIPKPGDTTNTLYYVFSTLGGSGATSPGMYKTLVDMTLNGGLGGVVQENIRVDSRNHADITTAIRHGNGRDWWLISKLSNTATGTTFNRFFVYLVNPNSVSAPFIQNLDSASDYDFQKMIWHPFESKFMLINVGGFMAEYDFDRCTGIITQNRIIFPEQTIGYDRPFIGGAYSTNGNVFYVSRSSYAGNIGNYNYLLQYDLTVSNIPASCDTLDSTQYTPVDCGDLRLAPDGKIYYSQAYASASAISFPYQDSMRNTINQNLGVINNPDVVGNGCNFAPFSFYLGGKRTYYGLPNNPDYSLGRLMGSPCDTLTVITEIEGNVKSPLLHLAPNPVTKILYFNAERVKGRNAIISIRNSLGQMVYEKQSEVFNGGYLTEAINVSGLERGVYFISLQTERENVTEKFLKQ